jgi:hypothetical protein
MTALAALLAATLQAEVSLVERDGTWRFDVSVRSDLSDGTLVHATMFYVTAREAGEDVIEEEVTLYYRDEKVEGFARLQGGRAALSLGAFPRRPPPVRYRVRVEARIAGRQEPLATRADTPEPSAEEVEAYDRAQTDRAREDFEAIRAIYRELRERYLDLEGFERAAELWPGCARAIGERIAAVEQGNADRFRVWPYWSEARGQIRIRGLAGELRRLVDAAGRALVEGGDAAARARDEMAAFERMWEDYALDVRIGPVFDPAQIEEPIGQVESVLRAAEEDAAAWGARRASWEGALLAMAGCLPPEHVERFQRLARVFREAAGAGGDAPAPAQIRAVRRAWEEFLSALRH